MRITFLGTGTSMGVPAIGCTCGTCQSEDVRDKRLRSSVWLTWDGFHVVIDAGPDFRLQALTYRIPRLDVILLTHAHADHVFGLDDVRGFNFAQGEAIPVLASQETLHRLHTMFTYMFQPDPYDAASRPCLRPFAVEGPFCLHGLEVIPIPAVHGSVLSLGYRIGPMAYLTDLKTLLRHESSDLTGLEVLILGVLRKRPHPTHLSVAEALDLLERIRPRTAYFTHISHEMKHDVTSRELPSNVHLAWDGLVVEVDHEPWRCPRRS
jgi:phosphoribosyl 1,2-cyclic phosphate phosphodiesterase